MDVELSRTVTVTHSEALRGKIELASPALYELTSQLYSHPQIVQLYPEYLFVLHCMIRASVPLMEEALNRSSTLSGDSSICRHLSAYFEDHISEELHHDEWLLDDLESLGYTRAKVLSRCPPAAIASMVGAQYYWIKHHHPVALIGYIAVMEGSPPTVKLAEQLRNRTGFPAAAFRTLLKHAKLDQFHKADLDSFMDTLPLTGAESALIGLSALRTVEFAIEIFQDLLNRQSEVLLSPLTEP